MNKEIEICRSELIIHPITDARLVVLKDVNGKVILTIAIEMFAVASFYLSLYEEEPNSAPAHKAVTNMIKSLGGNIYRVVIDDLQEGRFFATIDYVNSDGEEFFVKAEASDALALAYRMKSQICVKESIINVAKNDRRNRIYWYTEDENLLEETRAFSHEKLVALASDDLKLLLEIATDTEDFEFAARLKKAMDVQADNLKQFEEMIKKAMCENPLKFYEDLKKSLKKKMPNAIFEEILDDDNNNDDDNDK